MSSTEFWEVIILYRWHKGGLFVGVLLEETSRKRGSSHVEIWGKEKLRSSKSKSPKSLWWIVLGICETNQETSLAGG